MADRQPLLRGARGLGLMLAVDFATGEIAEIVQFACFQRGLLVLECGTASLRLAPPLTVDERDVATALRLLEDAVADVAVRQGSIAREAAAIGALNEVEEAI